MTYTTSPANTGIVSPSPGFTDFHAKYWAYDLTKRSPSDSVEKLANAVAGAQVDLNPHQVDAALFAFQSPLSRGALLADEVGLGKTIEAGLVISQRWAERKRRILIIVPSNLRKQWQQELSEKFFLPCRIIEAKSYNAAIRQGNFRPFEEPQAIVICSYQFARNKAAEVQATPWDLVVIDEAHRLRNVYKPSNVIANTLKLALASRQKLLLTATPLQNSLLELFGLMSIIDEHAFGDLKSFREQYQSLTQEEVFQSLRSRLRPMCIRTLRRQVTPYISYTKRLPMVEEFSPEDSEDALYELVSEYLRRNNLQALPASQRTLMTLVLRKLLASSTFAIAGALNTIAERLRKDLYGRQPETPLDEELDEDYEALDETAEEWGEEEPPPALSEATRAAMEAEIRDLETFAELASSIRENGKGKALLTALDAAMKRMEELGAEKKAIIFTESRRTQDYLLRILADSPWNDGLVLFNGSNTDERSRAIYADWVDRHRGTDRISGSRTADMRSALVDYFRERGQIMIATEAGAEGINLQFCSLVVNYDLPWNPQRIEQRIGRCHRYGQKHDVVVLNFINRRNEADRRVYELLSQKFNLFEGVFGASDEVLGAIESGVDFEKRINDIYQRCRRHEEIQLAFDDLQKDLSEEIDDAMAQTRRKLLENFDEEVREKLRLRDAASKEVVGRVEQLLMRLTRHELNGAARFESEHGFWLDRNDFDPAVPLGLYELPRRSQNAHTYRLGHPLAETIIQRAQSHQLPPAHVEFDYGAYGGLLVAVEPLRGQTGYLAATLVTVDALDHVEDHLVLVGVRDDGTPLEPEAAHRLFSVPAQARPAEDLTPPDQLQQMLEARQAAIRQVISERNARFFEAEAQKLDGWAEDLKLGLEREIKELDRQIREAKKTATVALTLEDKLAGQKEIRALESQRSEKRRSLFDAQDEIDRQRSDLIANIEGKLGQKTTVIPLLNLRWSVK